MTEAEHAPRFPWDLAPALGAALHAEWFPNGDRAALKRMAIGASTPLAYWRFLTRHVPEQWQTDRLSPGWRTLICAIAQQHQNPHDGRRPFGRALADIGFSEARLESLLSAEGRVLETLALRAARRLATERARFDSRELAQLLFASGQEARERINEKIAREYYRAQTRNTQPAA